MNDNIKLLIIGVVSGLILLSIAEYSAYRMGHNKGYTKGLNDCVCPTDTLAIYHFRDGYAYGVAAFIMQSPDSTLYDMWLRDSANYRNAWLELTAVDGLLQIKDTFYVEDN